MKIAFILYGKADKRSGGFLYDSFLIRSLERRGHCVRIFSQNEGSFAGKILENSMTRYKFLIDFNPDLIIEDELNHPSLFLINRKLKSVIGSSSVAVVHHLRSDEKLNFFLKPFIRFIEYLFLNSCDAFIFNSNNTMWSAEKLLKKNLSANPVVYPGKDNLPLKDRLNKNNDIINILFAGNLVPRKNPDLLLRVLKKISGKRWKLFICGAGNPQSPYYIKLKKTAADLIKTGQIEFSGRVSDEKLSSMISESDLLIVPSDWEGFGIIYLEAMRGGAVPVASQSGGAGEIIDDRENGFLIPPEDESSLEQLLREIIDNPGILCDMQRKGIKKAENFPTWDDTMKKAVNFIEIINDGKFPASGPFKDSYR